MISVLIDIGYKDLNECFGVSSCLELPLFNRTLGSEILKNINLIKTKKTYVYSTSSDSFENDFDCKWEIINDIDSIKCVFLSQNRNYVLFFFSDTYFEIQDDLTLSEKFFSRNTVITSFNGDLIGIAVEMNDVFEMISNNEFTIEKLKSCATENIKIDCYSKVVNNPSDYKSLVADILKGKTAFRLPEVAQGVFAESKIPQGDFVIIPPVFFDEGVQVENGCVIGPCTSVMKNSLIAKNSNVRNSFVGQGSYISSGCFLDGVMCCENVTIRRNSVVFSDTVLGRESSLGEDSIIENSSYIRPFSRIDDFKKNYVNFKQENNQSPAGFYGYSPEKSALLGAVIGIAFNSPKIAVAGDGHLNSTALKLALMGGLMTTGAACYDFGNTFLSSLHYYMSFCELECAVFISGSNDGTAITVFSKNTYSLSNSDYYNIKNIMTFSDIKRCNSDECKGIRQIHGMQRMYVQNLIKDFNEKLDFMPIFECKNKRILTIVEIAASKIGFKTDEKRVLFNINQEGTKLTAEYNGICYSHGKLLEIASHFVEGKGDVFYKNLNKNQKELWSLDAVVLCFKLIEILHENNMNLKDAYKALPTFYLAENTITTNLPLSALASRLSSNNSIDFVRGELRYQDGETKIRINKNVDGSLKIVAKAVTVEAAKEIVGNLCEMISKYS